MIELIIISICTFILGYFAGCYICHRNRRRSELLNSQRAVISAIKASDIKIKPMEEPSGKIPYVDMITEGVKSGVISSEKVDEIIEHAFKPRRVQVIDKATGKVKYEGTVYPFHQMCDATEISLDGGGSRIHYWMDNTESMEYID